MIHPENKKLLYFFIKNGARLKERIIHPQPLLDQLHELDLLEESNSSIFINHQRVITITSGENEHFFTYIKNGEGYYLEYLNEKDSSPQYCSTHEVKDLISRAQKYIIEKELNNLEKKKKQKPYKILFSKVNSIINLF